MINCRDFWLTNTVQTAITLLESRNLPQDAGGYSIDSKRALLAELQSLQ